MSKIADQKINEFLADLGSKNPTPGGGAVAALTGALSASLCLMVVALTKADLKDVGKKLLVIKNKFLELGDADVAAFDAVMIAYKSKNKIRIIKALKKATDVPQQTADLALEVSYLAKMLIKYGNKNAVSDAKTAFHLAKAAQKSAMENVLLNKLQIDKITK